LSVKGFYFLWASKKDAKFGPLKFQQFQR
jgi:hypothetical protein